MRNPFFYVLLLVLIVLDGWLLANPNLIGQLQDFYLERTYLETFAKALGTVGVIVGIAFLIAWLAGRLGRVVGLSALLGLLVVSGYWLFRTYTRYTSGIDQFTGEGFRAGAVLLPGLVVLVFGAGFFDLLQRKPARR